MEFNERKDTSDPCCRKCTWPRLRACGWITMFIGVALVCVGWFLPPAINNLINSGINDSVLLTVASAQNNDQVYRTFASYLDPDAAYIRYSVYMWNTTNPREVILGEKPIVEQVGPYVFREVRQRLNATFSQDINGHWVVDYYEWLYYIFEPTMTDPALNLTTDTFTVPNVVFWGLAGTLNGTALYNGLYDLFLRQVKKNCGYVDTSLPIDQLIASVEIQQCALYQTHTASDFFFGFTDPVLLGGTFAGVIGNVTDAQLAADPSLALHHQIYTGEDDPSLSRQYKMFGGTTTVQVTTLTGTVPMWGTDFANRIYGTDGTQFSRNPTPGGIVPAFVSELYRAVQLENVNSETVEFKGINLYRYRLSPTALQNETVFPYNSAYYLTESGVLNVSVQNSNAPIYMTRPHCLYVDFDICNLTIGQQPNADAHDTYIDVEPNTGMTMHAGKRLQANFHPFSFRMNGTIPHAKISAMWFTNIHPDILLPMFWVEEYGEVTDSQADDVKSGIYLGQSLSYFITYIVSIFGAFFIGLATLLFHCAVNRAYHVSHAKIVQQTFLDTEPVNARSDYSAL